MARSTLLLIAITLLAPPAGAASAIGAGGGHTCAVIGGGRVACWGNGGRGQLGDGASSSRALPAAVPGLSGVVELALGREHTCARTGEGQVFCFGRNDQGQLGDGTTRDRAQPAPVQNLAGARALAAGDHHTCALLEGGEVRCWGANRYGQLGDGSRLAWSLEPVKLQTVFAATGLAAGFAHTCALVEGGRVACAGANFSGQLGDGTRIGRRAPAFVKDRGHGALEGLVEIAAGEAHTCARRAAPGGAPGEVLCWGAGAGGQLGDGETLDRPLPEAAPALSPAKGLVLARVFSCAVRDEGLTCVGDRFGAKGRDVPLPGARAYSGGGRHACAVTTSGEALCLGDNDSGQLGEGSRGGLASRALLAVPLHAPATRIAAREDRTCARLEGGDVTCWGGGAAPEPAAKKRSLEASLEVSSSRLPCRLVGQGRVRCKDGRKSKLVRGLKGARAVAAGERFACALSKKGRVLCWGDALRGELGDGELVSSSPRAKRVPTLEGVTRLVAGRHFACALDEGGRVSCWGAGEQGQLGDGTLQTRASPAPALGLDEVTQLVAGDAHACALQRSGEVSCWGALLEPRPVPARIEGAIDVVELEAGAAHTCARREAGEVLCWGEGARGQLGQGARLSSELPLPVVGLDAVSPLAGG